MFTELFFILLVAGLILVGAEVFVPGGILGAMGALALLGAVVLGFVAFPAYGLWIALGMVVLVGVAFLLWIKIFPGTRMGKSMTVATDLADSKATQAGLTELTGKVGVATSDLRPGGFAEIEGRRRDVITRGEMIARGESVVVLEVESNRIVVTGKRKD